MLGTGVPAVILLIIAAVSVFSPVELFRNVGVGLAFPVAAAFTSALLTYSIKIYETRNGKRPSKAKVRWTYFAGGPILLAFAWILFSIALVRGGGPIWNELFANQQRLATLEMKVVHHSGRRKACRKSLRTDHFMFPLVTDICLDENKKLHHITHSAYVEIEYSESSLGILVKSWKIISGS